METDRRETRDTSMGLAPRSVMKGVKCPMEDTLTSPSQVAQFFGLAAARVHILQVNVAVSWRDTGAMQGLLTCQSLLPQWQTGCERAVFSCRLPDVDRRQAAELSETADVLHCGRYPHFLGGELPALLDE
ncbi:hypothetical protein Q8A73_007110 [Channa argus]|nr:hypothetical protein Q8A73_007110 [Channa argus]